MKEITNKEDAIIKSFFNVFKSVFEKGILKVVEGDTYSSPLRPIVEKVINAHAGKIEETIHDALLESFNSKEFKEALKKSFNEKLAKILVGSYGGEIESRVNALKANPETRARITLAIAKVMEEIAKGENR